MKEYNGKMTIDDRLLIDIAMLYIEDDEISMHLLTKETITLHAADTNDQSHNAKFYIKKSYSKLDYSPVNNDYYIIRAVNARLHFNCPLFARLYCVRYFIDKERSFTYEEFITCGTLLDHINMYHFGMNHLKLDDFFIIAYGMAQAIKHMHDKGYIHRDIKPDNFVLTNSGHVVLIDFDYATYGNNDNIVKLTNVGTEGYMSPELYFNDNKRNIDAPKEPVSFPTDVYSYGVTLAYLIYNFTPKRMQNYSTNLNYKKIITEELPWKTIKGKTNIYTSKIDQTGIFDDIIDNCVKHDPTQRPKIAEVVRRLEEKASSLRLARFFEYKTEVLSYYDEDIVLPQMANNSEVYIKYKYNTYPCRGTLQNLIISASKCVPTALEALSQIYTDGLCQPTDISRALVLASASKAILSKMNSPKVCNQYDIILMEIEKEFNES